MSRLGAADNLKWLQEQGEFNFINGDVRNANDVENVIRSKKPDVVFHVAGQVAMTKSNASGNLISYTMQELRSGNIPTYGPCEQPYNFTYIDDVISALYILGKVEKHSQNGYFIGNGECRILKEYLQSVAKTVGGKVGIGIRVDDGVKYQSSWFENKLLQDELGFRPKYKFEDGLKEMLASEK